MPQEITVSNTPKLPSRPSINPLSTLLQIGGDLISQGMQNKWNARQATLANQRNMELSKYQYQQQKEMYNLANTYNTPSAQMQRYKDAGLNPNLIYGQGTSGNAPNVLPQYKAPQFEANIRQPVNPVQAIERGLDLSIRNQQLDNLKAQRRILEAQAFKQTNEAIWSPGYYRYRTLGSGWESQKKKFDLLFKTGQAEYDDTGAYSMLQNGLWYQSQMARLGQYNANIALINANKDLREKEVAGYMTPLGKSLWNLGTTVAGGLTRAGVGALKGSAGLFARTRANVRTSYGIQKLSNRGKW